MLLAGCAKFCCVIGRPSAILFEMSGKQKNKDKVRQFGARDEDSL